MLEKTNPKLMEWENNFLVGFFLASFFVIITEISMLQWRLVFFFPVVLAAFYLGGYFIRYLWFWFPIGNSEFDK
jgi:hypothetical protein